MNEIKEGTKYKRKTETMKEEGNGQKRKEGKNEWQKNEEIKKMR